MCNVGGDTLTDEAVNYSFLSALQSFIVTCSSLLSYLVAILLFFVFFWFNLKQQFSKTDL